MKIILFLCTGNSCRSQMAEGLAKSIFPKDWEIYSAGIRADGLNKNAVSVMREIGLDISSQYSKTIEDIKSIKPNAVITLCDNAKEQCPNYPGRIRKIHWNLIDPYDATGTQQEILNVYRDVRDQIKDKLIDLANE